MASAFRFIDMKFWTAVWLSVGLIGCATLEHMDQLLTLQEMSKNGDLQHQYVESYDKKFNQLVEAVKTGRIAEYTDQNAVVQSFDQPIYIKEETKDGVSYEKWLYRYAAKLQNSQKVYLYFDQGKKLKSWEWVPPAETNNEENADAALEK